MTISCHGCGRQFRVRQDKLPAQGARTRCPRCDEVLIISPQGEGRSPEPPAPEPGTPTPAIQDGELFELPPADLLTMEDDLFALEDPDSSTPRPEPVPATETPAQEALPEAGGQELRRGGLRGWLARLFSHDS